ncbi:RND transporter [Profundibacter sp.]
MSFLDNISWPTLIMVALLLGLAPFVPEPHVLEKLRMLMAGELSKPIDIFDLVMHGAPWVLVLAKLARMGQRKGKE